MRCGHHGGPSGPGQRDAPGGSLDDLGVHGCNLVIAAEELSELDGKIMRVRLRRQERRELAQLAGVA
jgi:hypothetical protein